MSIIQLEYYNRYGDFLRTSTRVFTDVDRAASYGHYIVNLSKYLPIKSRPTRFKFRNLLLSDPCQ